jgi:hypothetical protein
MRATSPTVQSWKHDDGVSIFDCVNIDHLRARWLDLMRRELPEAAGRRPDWPIRLDHCFGRVILDAVHGRPWREAVPAPAYRHMDAAALRTAIALAEAILAGDADLHALNRESLRMRARRAVAP